MCSQTDRQRDRRGHHDTSQQLSSQRNPVRSVRAGATHAKSGQSDFADDSRRALRSMRSGRAQFPALSSPAFLAFHTNLAPATDVTLVTLLSTQTQLQPPCRAFTDRCSTLLSVAVCNFNFRRNSFTARVQPCIYRRMHTIRYERCYFNVRSKADTSQLNLPHGTDN